MRTLSRLHCLTRPLCWCCQELWSVFIKRGAPFQVPLPHGLTDGFRRYFCPRAGDVASGHKLPPISELVSELDGHASFARSSGRMLLANEAAAASTIALLLQVRLI